MRTIIWSMLLLLAGALAAPAAEPASGVTVRLIDGQSVTGQDLAASGGKLFLVKSGEAAPTAWPLDEVSRIDFSAAPATPAAEEGGWVKVVGGALRGTVKDFDGDTFTVTSADFGELKLPIAAVTAVVLAKAAEAKAAPATGANSDVVTLKNGDSMVGTVNKLDAETVYFHSNVGDLKLERGRVAAMRIAEPSGGRPAVARPALRLTLVSGSAVELSDITIASGKVSGKLCGGAVAAAPLESVVRADVVGGRSVPLESLKPESYEQHSLDMLKWQIVPGRNVLGQPMQLRVKGSDEPRTFDSGIGVHSPCRIVYQLDGRFERFLALVGIDESAGQWADATIIIRADGKELFRAEHIKWREPAREVNLVLAGAKALELVVEVGENFDIQGRIDWAEARLLRAAGGAGDK